MSGVPIAAAAQTAATAGGAPSAATPLAAPRAIAAAAAPATRDASATLTAPQPSPFTSSGSTANGAAATTAGRAMPPAGVANTTTSAGASPRGTAATPVAWSADYKMPASSFAAAPFAATPFGAAAPFAATPIAIPTALPDVLPYASGHTLVPPPAAAMAALSSPSAAATPVAASAIELQPFAPAIAAAPRLHPASSQRLQPSARVPEPSSALLPQPYQAAQPQPSSAESAAADAAFAPAPTSKRRDPSGTVRCCGYGPFNAAFFAELEFAARSVVAIGLSVLVILLDSTADFWQPTPEFVPIFALNALGGTLGKTLENARDLALANFMACVVLAVAMHIDLQSAGPVGLGFCVFAIAFVAFYFSTHLLARKLFVAVSTVLLLTVVPVADKQRSDLPWRVLAATQVGSAFGIVAQLFPFPRLAARQARDWWRELMHDCAQLCAMSVRAFVCTDTEPGRLDVLRVHSRDVLNAAATRFHGPVRQALAEAEWECGGTGGGTGADSGWCLCAGSTRSARAFHALRTDMGLAETLLISVRGMNHALGDLHSESPWHKRFVDQLKPKLAAVNHAVQQVIAEVTTHAVALHDDGTHCIPSAPALEAAWRELDAEYLRARHNIWFRKADRPSELAVPTPFTPTPTTPAMAAAGLPRNGSDTDLPRAALRLRPSSGSGFDALGSSGSSGGVGSGEPGASRSDVVLAMNFFLTNLQCFVGALTGYVPDEPAPLGSGASTRGRFARACTALWLYARSLFAVWDLQRAKHAFKVALAVLLTSLLVLVPGATDRDPRAFWAPFTVSLVMGESLGSTWFVTARRLEGTVIGCIAGYLIDWIADGDATVCGILAVLFTAGANYIAADPENRNRYSAVVSAVSVIVVVFGRDQPSDSVSSYALYRITNTFLAVATAVLVNVLLFPVHASVATRRDIVLALKHLRDSVSACFDVYESLPTTSDVVTALPHHVHRHDTHAITIALDPPRKLLPAPAIRGPHSGPGPAPTVLPLSPLSPLLVTKPLQYVNAARALIAAQENSIDLATKEHTLWGRPYPKAQFEHIIRAERRVMIVVRVLATMCKRLTVMQFKPAFVTKLKDEVLVMLDLFQTRLTVVSEAPRLPPTQATPRTSRQRLIDPETLVRLHHVLRRLEHEHEEWIRYILAAVVLPPVDAPAASASASGSVTALNDMTPVIPATTPTAAAAAASAGAGASGGGPSSVNLPAPKHLSRDDLMALGLPISHAGERVGLPANAGLTALSSFIFALRLIVREALNLGHTIRHLLQYEQPELFEHFY